MKSELAKKLKEVLDQMSQEEFDQEWFEILGLGLPGISADEMISSFEFIQEYSGGYDLDNIAVSDFSISESYSLAA